MKGVNMETSYKKMLADLDRRNQVIRELRAADPEKWTLAALGKKYTLTPQRIMVICAKGVA